MTQSVMVLILSALKQEFPVQLSGMRGIFESIVPSLQVAPPALITLTMMLFASPGVISVLPLHAFCIGVVPIAVVKVV